MRKLVKRRRWILLLNAFLLLLAAVSVCIFLRVRDTLEFTKAAERWRGGNELHFTQVACYLPESGKIGEEQIDTFRRAMDQAMVDASLEAPKGSELYVDAYSGAGRVSVFTDYGSADVKVLGVGGDFFQFHPFALQSGSYLAGNDLMDDRVILDETLSWQLFGGSDVAGMTVMIGQTPYYVAGVIRREDDFASQSAYLDGAGMFMSYRALQQVSEVGISCYEIVLPDPVSGFGLAAVKENFPLGDGDLVEVSTRYSPKALFGVIRDFGKRSMRTHEVIYPYWENAARMTEDILALCLVLALLFALCPAVSLLVFCIRLVRRLCRSARRRIPEQLSAAIERKKEKKFAESGE